MANWYKTFIILFLFCSNCFADGDIINSYALSTQGGGTPTCTTVLWGTSAAIVADLDINDAEPFTYIGQVFSPVSSGSVTCVEIDVTYKAGDISSKLFTGSFTILDGSSNFTPGSITNADTKVTGSNAWSITTIQFKFTGGFPYTSGNDYVFVVTMDGAADASNYAELEYTGVTVFPSGVRGYWNSSGVNQITTSGDNRCTMYSD